VHHPTITRTGANIAMTFIPARDKLLGSMFPADKDDARYKHIFRIIELIMPIKTELWKFYSEKDLTKLP